jgi:hypothetical protein
MQSLTPYTLAAGVMALICCFRSVAIIRQLQWIPITAVLGLSLLLRTTLAIPIQDLFPVFVDFSDVAKNRAAVSMLIFAAVFMAGQEIMFAASRRQRQVPDASGYTADKLLFFAALFWGIAMLGHVYFLFIKQNIEFFPTAIRSFADPEDHYGYRAYFTQMVYDARRGQWVSYMAMFLFSPLALVLLASAYLIRKSRVALVLWVSLVVVTPFVQIIHGQRSPLVLFSALAILSFLYARKGHDLHRILLSKKLYGYAALLTFVALALGAGVYTVSDKMGPLDAIVMFFNRVFVVPAVTPNFIYELIPDQFDFRGLRQCLFMKDRFAVTSDVTYGDLSMALQGVSSNVNSCAVAVGYSGLGFLGAALVSIMIVGMAVVLDLLLLREPPIMRIAALLISLDPIQVLTSESMEGAVFSRGYVVCGLILIACFRLSRNKSVESNANTLTGNDSMLNSPVYRLAAES